MTQEITNVTFHAEVLNSSVPVLVDFFTTVCAPCRRLLPVLDELAREANGKYRIAKVNVWEQPELANQYRVSAVPTLLVFRDGEVVDKFVGYQDKRILQHALAQAESALP